jgi:4,5-DOPA dioxygenase extradiol
MPCSTSYWHAPLELLGNLFVKLLPTLFISHGAPTFALEPGVAGALLQEAGRKLPAIKAVLLVSPHWMTSGLSVMMAAKPDTIIDFGGFDPRLNSLVYPAPGHPALAVATAQLLESQGQRVQRDAQRGYDHGAWVPMLHLLPQADVPVFQLSMPHTLTAQGAFELGRMLQPLSEQGVLIVGSGSITHNMYEFRMNGQGEAAYAKEFIHWVRDKVTHGDTQALIETATQAPHAKRAHPTDEHYLPFLGALGAARQKAKVEVLEGGFTYGVIGMESYIWQPTDTTA